MINKKPIIGISLDFEEKGGYSSEYSWYALRVNYFEAVEKAGGTPIALPYHQKLISEYIEICDGLIIPGGDYDISSISYGEENLYSRNEKNNRVEFEKNLILTALKKNMPILGICAGMQLINVIFGGSLFQDISTQIPEALIHEQKLIGLKANQNSHDVSITPGSMLEQITKKQKFMVNSTHHQAIKTLGENLIISATAPDNVIEAIENKNYKFLLGVEWHPEYLNSQEDILIFEKFIDSCII